MKKIVINLLLADIVKSIETGMSPVIPKSLYDLPAYEMVDIIDEIKRYMYRRVDIFIDHYVAGNRQIFADVLKGKVIDNSTFAEERDLYQLLHTGNFLDCMRNQCSINEMLEIMKTSGFSTHMLNEIFDFWSDHNNNEWITGTETRALRALPSVMTNGMTPSQIGALPKLAHLFHNGEIFDDPKVVVKVCEDIDKLGPNINWQQNKTFLAATEADKDKIRSIVAEIVNK